MKEHDVLKKFLAPPGRHDFASRAGRTSELESRKALCVLAAKSGATLPELALAYDDVHGEIMKERDKMVIEGQKKQYDMELSWTGSARIELPKLLKPAGCDLPIICGRETNMGAGPVCCGTIDWLDGLLQFFLMKGLVREPTFGSQSRAALTDMMEHGGYKDFGCRCSKCKRPRQVSCEWRPI